MEADDTAKARLSNERHRMSASLDKTIAAKVQREMDASAQLLRAVSDAMDRVHQTIRLLELRIQALEGQHANRRRRDPGRN